ncbi:V-type ATP synthase subunit F [Candidatus Desantisbacteria bacterium]|nr:V-type ATP synthase subunit F [Candidatus Desantisbacteria bacterium]
MYKVVVITDKNTVYGFRLAGIEGYEAETPEEAKKILVSLLNDDTIGIIGLNEGFVSAIDQRTQEKIDSVYRPIVVALPVREKLDLDELGQAKRSYLARLIRKAIGFDITLGKK